MKTKHRTTLMLVLLLLLAVTPVAAQSDSTSSSTTTSTTTSTPTQEAPDPRAQSTPGTGADEHGDDSTPEGEGRSDSTPGEESTGASTPTPEANSTSSSTVQVVGPLVRIVDWEYKNGAFVLELEAKAPALLTVTESIDNRGEGSGTFTVTRHRLASGRNSLTIPVAKVSGTASISLTTPGSLANNEGAYLKVRDSSPIIRGPFDGSDVTDAAIGGALAMLLAMVDEAVGAKLGVGKGIERVA